ncbi:MAG: molecular chaperone DnaK, partial [Alphaproteobacteria bacterium]
IESALAELKKAMEGDDIDAIRQKTEALAQASHKLAEHMYQQAQQGEGAAEAGTEKKDDDVVDAEFEDVDDKK